MNEIIKFLKKRRSVTAKKMMPGKVTESDLNDILECALRVPDHGALLSLIHISEPTRPY